MSLFDRFKVDPDEDHRGRLFHSPDSDPLPIRGPAPPLLTDTEADRLEQVAEAYLRLFDTADAQDRSDLQKIYTRVVHGWYAIKHEEHHFDREKRTMLVYLEWFQMYNEVPAALRDRVFTENGFTPPDRGI